jgi:prevent-host-death family protein
MCAAHGERSRDAKIAHSKFSLQNTMRSFSITEAKVQFNAIIEMIGRGETITITKHGKPVVNMVPANAWPIKPKMDLEELRRFRESIPMLKTTGVEIIRQMRDGEIEE